MISWQIDAFEKEFTDPNVEVFYLLLTNYKLLKNGFKKKISLSLVCISHEIVTFSDSS